MKTATIKWSNGMQFIGETGSGHSIVMDARPEVGGEDRGPRPGELPLVALGGCTGMDVVSILRKMRVPFDRFEIDIEGDEAAEHPKAITDIRITYRLWGEGIPEDRYIRAVQLSQNRYCSVSALLQKGANIRYRCELNGTEIYNGVPMPEKTS